MKKTKVGWSAGLAACLAMMAMDALAAEITRYVVLVDGTRQAGHQVVTTGDDGVTHVDFIFKDNGRGPELKETFTLAPDHTLATYQVTGSSTFGAPVDESFKRQGGQATWKSTSDQGEQSVSGTAMYAPLGGSPAMASVSLGALAKRPDGKLPLIPGGTLSARKITEVEVKRGQDTRRVQLMALTGIGLVPQFVWATTDAEPRLFAAIVPGWMQLIEDGWNENAAALEQRQKQAEGEFLSGLNTRVAHPLAGTTLIRNARLFDSAKATLGPASDVLVKNGRIVSIKAAGGRAAKADQVVDAANRVLLPGLFDMHGHVGRWDGGLNLAAGVTTVRDMGNDNATLQQIIGEEKAGTLLTSRIVAAGFLEGESPMSARNGFVIKTLDEAKKAVDWYASHGYVQVKIYNSFPKDLLRETTAYAHSKGLRVSGHVPAFMRARDVVEQGYDEIQHINQVLLNFLVDDTTDTRTLQRFYLPAEKVADLDFDGPAVQDFIALLAKHKTVVDPTLATFDFLRQRAGEMSQAYAAVAPHMPPDIQRGLRSAEMKIPDEATAERYNRSYAKMIEFVGRMHRAGVPIVAGTDAIPGFTLQRELELYVQAGMTPGEALQSATWTAAKVSRVLDDRGTIEVGKRADLVLIDGDPVANIADIRKVALVVKGDVAYYPSEIDEALGIKPFAAPVTVSRTGR
ncbi:amidohydrolase [Lysobacter daejeonensis GH1-9]|uniref:Amidohydrolase n=1 Tax=Lysobacter daejeonensis GH1-9 TaxID=1385517 RepID=A0A0A0F0S4_9GAMM|nr:amidohydrolase family protein [Lysobacter daejeonensis]KGM55863.1 amidohydrolase [Lysobacter daejeonensis GH1-9]